MITEQELMAITDRKERFELSMIYMMLHGMPPFLHPLTLDDVRRIRNSVLHVTQGMDYTSMKEGSEYFNIETGDNAYMAQIQLLYKILTTENNKVNLNKETQTTMNNSEKLAEDYIKTVVEQKEGNNFTSEDMKNSFLSGAMSTEKLQDGQEGTFGQAIGSLKLGLKVCRKGWNGKGMWLWLKQECKVKSEWCHDPALKELADKNGGEIYAGGCICLKTAKDTIQSGWTASQEDILATDWILFKAND